MSSNAETNTVIKVIFFVLGLCFMLLGLLFQYVLFDDMEEIQLLIFLCGLGVAMFGLFFMFTALLDLIWLYYLHNRVEVRL